MLRSAYPNFPVVLEHLDGLSDDQSLSLLVSPRTLYVLQNGVLGLLREQAFYASARFGEQYIPVDEADDYFPLYISALADLERDIVETQMIDFEIGLTQGSEVTKTINLARYQILGNMAFVSLWLQPTEAGDPNNPITLYNMPNAILPKVQGWNPLGNGYHLRTSIGWQHLICIAFSAPGIWYLFSDQGGGFYGQTPAVTLAANEVIALNLAYEI